MTCSICELDPSSHSLKKISENDNMTIYYTCPAQASKYYDCSGIIHHYTNEFNTIKTEKWMWIIDCSGYGLIHLMQHKVGIGLGQLISTKYSHHLEKICIINPNWYIYSMSSIVWPFLNKKVKSIILYDNKKYNLENMP
jgi:hypothetical protein